MTPEQKAAWDEVYALKRVLTPVSSHDKHVLLCSITTRTFVGKSHEYKVDIDYRERSHKNS